jgi:xanthine dehydrogenase YagR molybdenum-binding subunit
MRCRRLGHRSTLQRLHPGCRGAGEIGITGVAAAIANAVYHATGKRVRELPITPDKLMV